MQRWIPATVALFGLFAFFVLFVPRGSAQINSASASMGSSGSGGHAATGEASVTSFGHHGFTPPQSGSTFTTHVPTHSNGGRNHNPQRHHQDSNSGRGFAYPYLYLYPVPYGVPYAADDPTDADAEDDSDYQGGPTVFDRRGSGADSYVPPAQDAIAAHSIPAADSPEPESPPDPTTLVFRDGHHQMEVGNYAIVGQTLYDLTPGHPRKIALADLNLPSTEKENDDRGISFQLPPSAQTN